jgi:hypothetical protein
MACLLYIILNLIHKFFHVSQFALHHHAMSCGASKGLSSQ